MTSLCREKWVQQPTSQRKRLVTWTSPHTHCETDDFLPDYKGGLPLVSYDADVADSSTWLRPPFLTAI